MNRLIVLLATLLILCVPGAYAQAQFPPVGGGGSGGGGGGGGGSSTVFTTWTTITRPISPTKGQAGFNTTLGAQETWNGTFWFTDAFSPDVDPSSLALGTGAGETGSTGGPFVGEGPFQNTYIGGQAGQSCQGAENTYVGSQSGMFATAPEGSVAVGAGTLTNDTTGSNIAIGPFAGSSNMGSAGTGDNIIISLGGDTPTPDTSGYLDIGEVIFGSDIASVTNPSSACIGILNQSPEYALDVTGDIHYTGSLYGGSANRGIATLSAGFAVVDTPAVIDSNSLIFVCYNTISGTTGILWAEVVGDGEFMIESNQSLDYSEVNWLVFN